jgi:cellulose biosynthesis protein BcsQ
MQIVRDDWAEKPLNKTVPGGMKVLTLMNEKGGVGKTTLGINISAAAAARGYRVMLIDADAQANTTAFARLKPQPMLHDLIIRGISWADAAKPISPEYFSIPGDLLSEGQLFVVPSNLETRSIPLNMRNPAVFLKRIRELRDSGLIDLVIIDTSPTPSLLHAALFYATDAVIHPVTLSLMSFSGLLSVEHHRNEANVGRVTLGLPEIEAWGIIPTKYEENTLIHQHNMEKLIERYGDQVWLPLSKRTVWEQAEQQRLPIYSHDPTSKAALEFWEVLDQVEDRVLGRKVIANGTA